MNCPHCGVRMETKDTPAALEIGVCNSCGDVWVTDHGDTHSGTFMEVVKIVSTLQKQNRITQEQGARMFADILKSCLEAVMA